MLVHQLISCGKRSNVAFHTSDTIKYDQLQNEFVAYRNYFYAQGIRIGENVGLFSRNSAEFVYCYMALSSLGAVVVPLNFQLTAREIAYIVKDAQMKYLVSMEALDIHAELLQHDYSVEITQLLIPEFAEIFASRFFGVAPSLGSSIDENAPCVIIYTSGTTGNPKGAILTHKNLISNVRSFGAALPPGSSSDNILCVLPMYHSFAWTCAVLYPLSLGASVTILEAFSPKETIAAIKEKNVSIVFGVPPIYNYLTRMGSPDDLSSVNTFVSGGAALPQKVAELFQQKYGTPILEGYGLSEASPVVALNPLSKTKFCSIGRPLPDVNVRIVNAKGETLSPGEIGELVVQGTNVMQGYFNLPLETSRALRNDWLHTGDIAYQDIEGYLFIVDRLKDMIIINGENVYPREIEELLYSFPGVVEVAVIGVPDPLRGEAVRAYVAMEDGNLFDRKAIRDFLQPLLAGYKLPRDIIRVDALPKNKTGKIMKRLLREQVTSERGNAQTG
ncbi:MAG: AMP-binding protein [Negativicutes bacterium]